MNTPRTWYRFENKAEDPTVAEIHISDVIGSWDDDWFARNFGYDMGVTARAFVEDLSNLPAAVSTLKVHINSPGGDIQAGIQITNALREQQMSKGRTVETYIDGIAASIASVIAMAGSKVYIGDNALVMIHNPWGDVTGDAAEMRKTADILDAMRNQVVATYKWHSSLEDDAIVALMTAETWMDADQAIANGFATDKVAGLHATNSLARGGVLNAFKVPDKFKARVDALLVKEEQPAPKLVAASGYDIAAAVEAAGLADAGLIKALIAAELPIDQVTARIGAEKASRDAAEAQANAARVAAENRAAEITAVCKASNLERLAPGFIASNIAIDTVKDHVLIYKAAASGPPIDGSLPPDGTGTRQRAALNDLRDTYGRLNQRAGHKE